MKTEIRHYTAAEQEYGETDSKVVSDYLKNYYAGSGTRQEMEILGQTYKVLRRDRVTVFYDADGNTLFDVKNEKLDGEYSRMSSSGGIRKYTKTYAEYKAELDTELTKTAEGFVRIGYLLKVARDTDILRESGYGSVADFAKAEYGIDKTQVSRFIRINDRFSEDGNSDRLRAEYQGYGYAKLILMLQLPDAINEELSPGYSKSEIQTIKEEVDAEHQVTDIERMLEEENEKAKEQLQREGQQEAVQNIEQNDICRVITRLGEDDPNLFVEIYNCMKENRTTEDMIEIMAPQGEKTYSIRVPKMGRFLLMIKDTETSVQLINVRSSEKTTWRWEDVAESWLQLVDSGKKAKKRWSELYGREFPKVAPVQPEKKATKKEHKVTRAKENTPISPPNVDLPQCEGDLEAGNKPGIEQIPEPVDGADNEVGAESDVKAAEAEKTETDRAELEIVSGEVGDAGESMVSDAGEEAEHHIDNMQLVILKKIDKIRESVIEKNWRQAVAALEDTKEAVKRAEWMGFRKGREEWMDKLEEDEDEE